MSDSVTPILKFDRHGPITVGSIPSTQMLDGANVSRFGTEVLAYVRNNPSANILIDFEKVHYMSSAGLTELLRINDTLSKGNGSVRLCGLSPDIRKVFEITNLDKLFVIHEDDHVDAATKRFERSLSVAAEEDAWTHPDSGG